MVSSVIRDDLEHVLGSSVMREDDYFAFGHLDDVVVFSEYVV